MANDIRTFLDSQQWYGQDRDAIPTKNLFRAAQANGWTPEQIGAEVGKDGNWIRGIYNEYGLTAPPAASSGQDNPFSVLSPTWRPQGSSQQPSGGATFGATSGGASMFNGASPSINPQTLSGLLSMLFGSQAGGALNRMMGPGNTAPAFRPIQQFGSVMSQLPQRQQPQMPSPYLTAALAQQQMMAQQQGLSPALMQALGGGKGQAMASPASPSFAPAPRINPQIMQGLNIASPLASVQMPMAPAAATPSSQWADSWVFEPGAGP